MLRERSLTPLESGTDYAEAIDVSRNIQDKAPVKITSGSVSSNQPSSSYYKKHAKKEQFKQKTQKVW